VPYFCKEIHHRKAVAHIADDHLEQYAMKRLSESARERMQAQLANSVRIDYRLRRSTWRP